MNTATQQRLILLVAGVVGLLFGIGLTLSEMVNPRRVLGFLDVSGQWYPTLAFVMGGALIVSIIGVQIMHRMSRPILASHFALPTKKVVDRDLLLGAAIFGIGWGLVGLCPGPAIAALSLLDFRAIVFVAAMLAGFLTHKRIA